MAFLKLKFHLQWCLVLLCAVAGMQAFQLNIMHTNDIHARYDQTNKYSGQCSDSDDKAGKCFGGFPRLLTKVNELRAAYNNTVLVDAGDQYQGTIWFYRYGGNATAHFMNQLGYDVMALGNHEFDNGPDGLYPLMQQANFAIISSNTDASQHPAITGSLRKSVVKDIGGEKVGFIGYTTTDTATISNPEDVVFNDEIAEVRSEAARLTSLGVNKIVCLGHAGFVKDQLIARDVPGVDIVVGGHTNTFLYNGEPPSNEDPVGAYPAVITQGDGSVVLVVQDYAYGKYLGHLQVEFDELGKITAWQGNPILLDNSTERNASLQAELDEWRKGVEEIAQKTIGKTTVFLQGDRELCRLKECNMGNLLTDAMVTQNLRHSDSAEWNHVSIALANSGSIRTSLEKGDISLADVLTVQPFRNTIDIVELNGSAIYDVMEHSASQWDPKELQGGFLQHSGLRVLYDMNQPIGRRVKDVWVKCTDCAVPAFVDLEPARVYKVIMTNFLAGGGDGFEAITKNIIKQHIIGDLDSDVLAEYITKYSPITHGLEGRILFMNETNSAICGTSGAVTQLPASSVTWFLSVVTSLLILLRLDIFVQ